MAEAEVGDDVFGDDPTVIALEARAAELTGKEAALFVASGTMGNLVSLMAHVPRGGEIIAGVGSHTIQHEAANHAVVVGASMRTLPWDLNGRMDLDDDPWGLPRPGRSARSDHLAGDAREHPLGLHGPATAGRLHRRGGSRRPRCGASRSTWTGHGIFNAAVALGTTVRELVATADSATFCISKGLACPVGSVVCGSRAFIWRARRARKLVGGGMRQAGVLAAPGLIALRDGSSGMIERLADDHANARRLAEGLVALPGIAGLDPARVRTNFVLFRVAPPGAADRSKDELLALRSRFLDELAREGALMIDYPGGQVRAVTHYGIEAADIDATLAASHRALHAVGLAPARVAAVAG